MMRISPEIAKLQKDVETFHKAARDIESKITTLKHDIDLIKQGLKKKEGDLLALEAKHSQEIAGAKRYEDEIKAEEIKLEAKEELEKKQAKAGATHH